MDALEKSTHEWHKLDEIFYRKFRMTMFVEPLKKINYQSCHIAVAKNGGLVAFIKKYKHVILENNSPIKDNLLVFYQNGVKEVEAIKFDANEYIVLFEFTQEEDLILLLADGRLYTFDIYHLKYNFDFIGLTFGENNIIDAKLFDKGIIMLTENGDFYYNYNYKEPNSLLYFSLRKHIPDFAYYNFNSNTCTSNLKGSINPNSAPIKNIETFFPCDFCIIPAEFSASQRNELIIPHPKQGVIIYVENDPTPKYLKAKDQKELTKLSGQELPEPDDLGQVVKICLSSGGSHISFYNSSKEVSVFSSTLDSENIGVSKVTNLTLTLPFQMMWCSDDCIITLCGTKIGLIGPDNKYITFDTKPNSFLVQEIDGIRVIQDDKVEFIQMVSKDLSDTIFPLSIDPAKKLLDAYKLLEENKPNCDAEVRKIWDKLPEAVMKILKAATTQWDMFNQSYLLKAAQHGKNYLTKDEFYFNQFVIVCKDLRIINNLRTSDKPRVITYDQYKSLEIRTLVSNILKMHNFYLAFEIYQYLGFDVKDIYEKWAISYIKNIPTVTTPDEEIYHFNHITSKISEVTGLGISLIKLAKESFKCKKEDLGIKFLEQEKSIMSKIPQYVELGKWNKAIELAIETYDSNMMNAVIDKMIKVLSVQEFISTTQAHVKAFPAIVEYLRIYNPELLETFLKSNNLNEELVMYYIEQFFKSSILRDRTYFLGQSKSIVQSVLKKQPTNEEFKFHEIYLNDLENSMVIKSDLLNENFIRSDNTNFDKPLFNVFSEAIAEEKFNYIELKNKQYFDISLKKLNIIRVKVYAELKLSEALRLLCQSSKPQFSNYLAFGDVCFNNNLNEEAVIFLRKVTDELSIEYKVVLLIEMNKLIDAIDVVIGSKEVERKAYYINIILNKDSSLQGKVKELCTKYRVDL